MRIFPAWEEINKFKTPLTEGERTLAKFFDNYLPSGWEIYVQPFLNGTRPDIVILNPEIGAMIWEVKDWNLKYYDISQKTCIVKAKNGLHNIVTPINQANHYKNNIMNLYVPILGEKVDKDGRNYGLIKCGVYFHNAKTSEVRHLSSKYSPHIGRDFLNISNLKEILPLQKHYNREFKNTFNYLKVWLIPPFHSKEQGRELKLTPKQKVLATPREGHQRIKGVAGSGKTLVLAYRAARLASEGKKVLAVTYNITLWHYIRDLIARAPFDFKLDNIVFNHFHGFCRDEYVRLGIEWPHSDDPDIFFKTIVPERLLSGLKNPLLSHHARMEQPKFDAILIDEGQDYCPEWYNLLSSYTTERDELALFCDNKQNIYERDTKWTDGAMKSVKFKGPWNTLSEVSYRLPARVSEKLNDFAVTFLDREPNEQKIKSAQMDLFNEPELIWENVNNKWEGFKMCKKAYDYFFNKGIQPSDMVFLVTNHDTGWELVKLFEHKGIDVNHVFEDENQDHHNKKCFWMGDSRLKMSTVHSFKGWEAKTVILFISSMNTMNNSKKLAHLVYTGISRTLKDICVINCCKAYSSFGETWDTMDNPGSFQSNNSNTVEKKFHETKDYAKAIF